MKSRNLNTETTEDLVSEYYKIFGKSDSDFDSTKISHPNDLSQPSPYSFVETHTTYGLMDSDSVMKEVKNAKLERCT